MAVNVTQARYRIAQGVRHLTDREVPRIDATLRELLTPELWELLERLSPADRDHLLRVHQSLIREGVTDQDLLLAGLLHDVGKADDRGRVTLFHRTLKVLVGAISRPLLERIADLDGGWIAHGTYLSLYHAELGATFARQAGASDRACWLITHHDDGTISSDSDLRLLQEIDARE
jgi:hypothetical protein